MPISWKVLVPPRNAGEEIVVPDNIVCGVCNELRRSRCAAGSAASWLPLVPVRRGTAVESAIW